MKKNGKKHSKKTVKKASGKEGFQLVRIPRFISVVLVMSLFLFVGEVFSENFQWSHFLPSLMPGSAYLLMAYAAWRNARIGGMLFVIAGIGLILADIAQDRNVLGMHVLALITFVLGCLFLVFRKK
ncbi:MAG: hypothetical protein WC120_01370 [Parcubacteria group bacterium]